MRFPGEVLRSEIFQGPYKDGIYSDIALETLNLGYNEIHSLDRYLFQHTPNLTRLYLNNNPIEILDYVTLLALSSASNLEVKKTWLMDEWRERFILKYKALSLQAITKSWIRQL